MRLLILLFVLLAVTPGTPGPTSQAVASPRPSPAVRAISPEELFSRRALRRARLLIQMRMLQLRDERLECVRAAILQRLPPELRPGETPRSNCRE